MTHENLDRVAQKAIHKHRDRKLKVILELTLGDLISLHGIRETRRLLLWHARHLKEFE